MTTKTSPILAAADTLEALGYRVERIATTESTTYAPAGDALRAYQGRVVVTIFPTYSGGFRVAGYIEYDETRGYLGGQEYKTAAGAIRKAREFLR